MDWKLSDYREYYGDQLKDLSDYDIAEKVRNKYYADMDPAAFYKEFGLDSGRGAVGRGLAKGIEQNIGAVVEGVPALYNSLMGNDEKAKANLAAYQKRLAASEARNPTKIKDFTEIPGEGVGDTVSRAATYAGESFGQLFPSLAMVIAGGGIGGAAAKATGAAALTGAARAVGAGAAGAALNTTESFVNLAEDGQLRPGEAIVTGAIKSALDALPAVQFLKRGAGELGEATIAAATKRLAERFGYTVAKDAGLEGLTEGAQEFVDQTASRLVGLADNYDFVKIIDSGVRGAVGSGPVAAVQTARGRGADQQFVEEEQARVDAANQEAEAALAAANIQLPPQPDALGALGEPGLADQGLDARQNAALKGLPTEPTGDEFNTEQATDEALAGPTGLVRTDMPGSGLSPEQLAHQTRMAQATGQPFGAMGNEIPESNTRDGVNTEPVYPAQETQPTFVGTDPEGSSYNAEGLRNVVSRPFGLTPGAGDTWSPPPRAPWWGPAPPGTPGAPDRPIIDAEFTATDGTQGRSQALIGLTQAAQSASDSVVALAPELAGDIAALQASTAAVADVANKSNADNAATAKAAEQTQAQKLQTKLDNKLAKANGPAADRVRALGPARVVGTVADAVVFEAGGKRFRTAVGSGGKIIELAGTPPGFKPLEGVTPAPAQATADPSDELIAALVNPPPVEQNIEQLTTQLTQKPAAPLEAPVAQPTSKLVKAADLPKAAPVAKQGEASPELGDKLWRTLKAQHTELTAKLINPRTKPGAKQEILNEIKSVADLMKKRQTYLINRDAEARKALMAADAQKSEELTPVKADEAVADAAEAEPDATEVPEGPTIEMDPVVEASDQADAAAKINADFAEDQYIRVAELPEAFDRTQAEAAGIHPDILDMYDGEMNRADLQDFLAGNAAFNEQGTPVVAAQTPVKSERWSAADRKAAKSRTDALHKEQAKAIRKYYYDQKAKAGAQPSPTSTRSGTSNTAEILTLARKLGGDGLELSFDPSIKWAGLAWNNKVVMGQKGTRTEQLLTAAHEVGGHALGHMGKLSWNEAAHLMSPAGQQALKRIIRAAVKDGHPTLSKTGMADILKHIDEYGKTETIAFGVEAAMWYEMNGKPLPFAPTGFKAFVNRVVAAIQALADSFLTPRWADVVRGLGFSREYTYLTDIVNGKMAGRSKGMYPPLGAVDSVFAAQLGYESQRFAELADQVLNAESALRRAQAAGNVEVAQQLAARISQLKEQAKQPLKQPSPFYADGDTQATEAIKFQKSEYEKTMKMAAETPDRLPWYLKVASPGFVAQMRPKLKPVFAALNDILVPWNIHLENGNRPVDQALNKAKPDELKSVTRLMEATNAARRDAVIDTKAGTATFTVPQYSDLLLKKDGLRHKIHLSKPGETIVLKGKAFDLYQSLRGRMDEMRVAHINSLLARAGLPDMSFEPTMSVEQFDAELERGRRLVEDSTDNPRAKQIKLGALLSAARTFEDRLFGYMPMVRQGEWLVRMNKIGGDSAADRPRVYAFASRREADAFALSQRKAEPNFTANVVARQQFDDQMLKSGNLEDTLDAADIILTNALSRSKGNEKANEALELLGATIQREKLNIAVRGLRARGIRRRDITGHIKPDENGSYLLSGVRPYLSQLATQASYNMAHPSIIEAMKGLPPDLQNYAQRSMVDAYLEPELWVARAKAAAFAWTIGGNPSSMLLNLPQLVLTTIPTLGASFGQLRAWREVTRATTQAFSEMGRSGELFSTDGPGFFELGKRWKGLTEDEQQFMQAALQGGLIDQGLATDTSGLLSGEGVRNKAAHVARKFGSKGLQIMGKMFGLSEQINRAATLLASYRLAKNAKPETLRAYMKDSYGGENRKYAAFKDNLPANYAMAVMQGTQGVFNKANRPVWMQGWAGIPTQFMQFPVFMLENIIKPFISDADGKRYIQTAQGKKFLGAMLGGLWALGGFMALPMMGSVDELLKKLTDLLGPLGVERVEIEKLARAAILDLLKGAGFEHNTAVDLMQATARGLPRLAGIDISRRIAIDLGVADFLFNADPTNYLGPFGSITMGSVLAAKDYVRESNDTMALFQLMPVMARNMLKATMLTDAGSELGISPAGGGDIISRAGKGLSGAGKASGPEVTAVALGFTPTRVAVERERVEEKKATGIKDQRERFVNTAADYLFFAHKAKEAGRDSEAQDYQRRYNQIVDDAIKHDEGKTDDIQRLIVSGPAFQQSLRTRFEERRSGQLGPAGSNRAAYFANERAKKWVGIKE